jgi:hypothetical protein
MEGSVAGRARRHLEGAPFLHLVRSDIDALHPAWYPERSGRPFHQFPVGITFGSAQSMINMQYLQWVTEPMEQMHQHHAVDTAAHSHPERGSLWCMAVMPQETFDSITHGGAHQ